MGCENGCQNSQIEPSAAQLGSQKTEEKVRGLKSETEKELEDCSDPKFKDEAGEDSHNESAMSSDLLAKHENSDTYI